MKKKILLVLLLVFAITLTGCGESSGNKPKDGEKEAVCTLKNSTSQGSVNSTFTIYYKDGYVHSKEVIESDSKEFLEALKEQVEQTYASVSKYGGYDYSVKLSGNKVTSTVTIDYSEMDMEKYAKDVPGIKQYLTNGKYTLEGAKKVYIEMGATCE